MLPAEACRVTGWKGIPHAGDVVMQVESEKRAKEVVRWREQQRKLSEQENIVDTIMDRRKCRLSTIPVMNDSLPFNYYS